MECICILTRLMGSCTLEDIPFCILPSNLLYKLGIVCLYAHGILCRIRPMRNGMNRPVSYGKIFVSLNYPQIPHLVLHQIAFIKWQNLHQIARVWCVKVHKAQKNSAVLGIIRGTFGYYSWEFWVVFVGVLGRVPMKYGSFSLGKFRLYPSPVTLKM